MSTDLTGGLNVEREYVLSKAPTTPEMRDAVNMWVWDDTGEIGLPRFAVEAVAPEWETHEIHLSVGFKDGRLLRNWESGPAHPTAGPDGRHTKFGAGPLDFECVEPFRLYRTTYDGTANISTFDRFVKSPVDAEIASLSFNIECETVVPPWVQGTMGKAAADMMSSTVEAAFMGGDRLEQLCRAKGTINVDGIERAFSGGALRVRRQGVRQISGFWGHCWQSTVFPSGRAFGYIAYPPRPTGEPSYNEGYVFMGSGALIPARVVSAPWLTSLAFDGEDVSTVIESDIGTFRIEAQTVMSMPTISQSGLNFPPLLQSIVRYRWDGEEAYGMMERSNLPQNVRMPD